MHDKHVEHAIEMFPRYNNDKYIKMFIFNRFYEHLNSKSFD